MVSTRKGMSSVTTSITSRPGSRVASAPGCHPDQGPALRPLGGQLRVLGCRLADPLRTGFDQIVGVDMPVVGVQEADGVGDAGACRYPVCGVRQQLLPGLHLVLRHLSHSLVA